jgi:hypothetical protein
MLVLVETLPVLEGTLDQDAIDYWHLYADVAWILNNALSVKYIASQDMSNWSRVIRVYAELEGSSLTWWLLNRKSYA